MLEISAVFAEARVANKATCRRASASFCDCQRGLRERSLTFSPRCAVGANSREVGYNVRAARTSARVAKFRHERQKPARVASVSATGD